MRYIFSTTSTIHLVDTTVGYLISEEETLNGGIRIQKNFRNFVKISTVVNIEKGCSIFFRGIYEVV